ncbi:MAG: transcription antitermination factor NusB [Muribaculaceae bacterium]|nr:transcription antitermination factor NusB [Muribaculaceae bacterium]
MTNRVLIRNKILQIVFSAFIDRDKTIAQSEMEYVHSIQKTYDLYILLLQLIVRLTDEQNERIERLRGRYINPVADKDIDWRLAKNRLAKQLSENAQLNDYLDKNPDINVVLTPRLVKSLLDSILESDVYAEYLEQEDSYEADKNFWKKILKGWADEPEIDEALEGESLYWNNDIDIIVTFALKTIKSFNEDSTDETKLIDSFDAEPDSDFPGKLLSHTILDFDANVKHISAAAKNWEADRIANMDFVIMCMALTEARMFPTIPINVTLSEYIELAKSYSSDKSATFINGVLDAIIKKMKKEGKIDKE